MKKTASWVINKIISTQLKMLANLFDGTTGETDYDGTSFPGNTFQRICCSNHRCNFY